jgi:hypothetical protein
MLVKDLPQFGIYNEDEYKLSKIVSIDENMCITYFLPDSENGVYNLVLHGLLDL